MAETKFTTSFIPKKPVQTVTTGGKIKRKKSSNIISLISFVIFLVVIVMAVGTFLYNVKLERDIEKIKLDLVQASESLDQQFIFEAARLDTRLKSVKKLLDSHLSPSQIFFLLEEFTITNLRFSNISMSLNGDGNVSLSGSGSGVGYESIIQQSDAYGQSEFLRDVIFSNLRQNDQGIVSFSFQSVVEPRLINYRESVFTPTSTFNNSNIQNQTGNQNGDILDNLDFQDNLIEDAVEDEGFDLQQELIEEEQ